jgi:hypothetical protein
LHFLPQCTCSILRERAWRSDHCHRMWKASC